MIGLKPIRENIYSILLISICIFVVCTAQKEDRDAATVITAHHIVKKGETLELILNSIVPHSTTTSIIGALTTGGFPFRKCLPGDSIEVQTKNDTFIELMYHQNRTSEYYVMNNQRHYAVAMKLPYIDTTLCLLRGEITSTLYESMLEKGETPNLVYRFADIFAWEIDFVTDTRKADSFYILFEKTFCDSQFVNYQNILAAYYRGEIGDYTGIYYKDPDGHEDYYNIKGESLRKSLLKSPLRFSYISSYFSKRRYHPILKVWRPHHGLDYVAPVGTPVSSIGTGTVTYKGWKGGYGNLVEIRHKNNFRTRYGHLSRFAKGLYKGKRVKMGELIGYVGSTGLSTGPHLHFEMHKNGVPINPLRVKIPRAPSVKKKYMTDFQQRSDSLQQFIQDLCTTESAEIARGE
jgi:murein DD-endopeptidase MepM/ murein hydrolase activator NlpD